MATGAGGGQLPPLGLWSSQLDYLDAGDAGLAVREAEAMGWRLVWIREGLGRDPFAFAAGLLSATDRLMIGIGVAAMAARDPHAAAAGAATLAEAFPHRTVVAFGVGHRSVVEQRGGRWDPPVGRAGRYLDDVAGAGLRGPIAGSRAPVLLGALGPRMLAVARDHAGGALTYLATPEHTATARAVLGPAPKPGPAAAAPAVLGPGPTLAAVQAVGPAGDPDGRRAAGRRHLAWYLTLPAYRAHLLRLGFGAGELEPPGSDRLVDALVCAPDEAYERVGAHFRAGADSIALAVVGPEDHSGLVAGWSDLARCLDLR